MTMVHTLLPRVMMIGAIILMTPHVETIAAKKLMIIVIVNAKNVIQIPATILRMIYTHIKANVTVVDAILEGTLKAVVKDAMPVMLVICEIVHQKDI